MYEAINQSRGLWTHFARQQIKEAYLAPASIPLSTMSVDEIRRCATRIYRLEHHLTISKSEPESPDPVTTLRIDRFQDLTLSFDVGDEYSRAWRPIVRLAPGGRWVIGVADVSDQVRLFCWDLHTHRNSPISSVLRPIAMIVGSQPVLGHQYRTFEMQYDKKDECINILLTYTSASNV